MGLDTVELILAIEEEFHINIPDDTASRLDTAGKLYEYVLMNHKSKIKIDEEDLWKRVTQVISYQLGVRQEKIHKHDNFVYDLGAD